MQIGSLMDRTDRGNFDNSRIRIENTRSSWESGAGEEWGF